MSIDGDEKEFQELAQRLRDGKKATKEGLVGDEHSFREDDDLKSNGTAEEIKVRQDVMLSILFLGQLLRQFEKL